MKSKPNSKLKKGTLNKLNTAFTRFMEHYEYAPDGKRAKNAAMKFLAVVNAARAEIEEYARV